MCLHSVVSCPPPCQAHFDRHLHRSNNCPTPLHRLQSHLQLRNQMMRRASYTVVQKNQSRSLLWTLLGTLKQRTISTLPCTLARACPHVRPHTCTNANECEGISNSNSAQIEELMKTATVTPAVNQCDMGVANHDDATIKYCQVRALEKDDTLSLLQIDTRYQPSTFF